MEHADLVRRLRELEDRRAVAETICRLDTILDEQRFNELSTVYAPDAVADFPSALMEGLDALTDVARRRMESYDAMQHATTNVLVTIDGDRATARANQIATHVHRGEGPGSHHETGVVHRFELVRTADGWRIARADAEVVWRRGTPPPPVSNSNPAR